MLVATRHSAQSGGRDRLCRVQLFVCSLSNWAAWLQYRCSIPAHVMVIFSFCSQQLQMMLKVGKQKLLVLHEHVLGKGSLRLV